MPNRRSGSSMGIEGRATLQGYQPSLGVIASTMCSKAKPSLGASPGKQSNSILYGVANAATLGMIDKV
jgi:hypothetical protein